MYCCQSKTIDLPHGFYPGSLPGVRRGHLLSDLVSFSVNSLANTKSLLLHQYIFSGGVHYCLNIYTCYIIRFHLLYDVLVVFDFLESRYLPPDKSDGKYFALKFLIVYLSIWFNTKTTYRLGHPITLLILYNVINVICICQWCPSWHTTTLRVSSAILRSKGSM
jgi:hypothetical protein